MGGLNWWLVCGRICKCGWVDPWMCGCDVCVCVKWFVYVHVECLAFFMFVCGQVDVLCEYTWGVRSQYNRLECLDDRQVCNVICI